MVISPISCTKAEELKDSHGHLIRLSDYQGKYLVVNYWATWCKPCITELPALNTFYKTHRDTVVVLGVNVDAFHAEKINSFVEKLALSFPLLSRFPLNQFTDQTIDALPTTFIFSPQRKLVKILYGPQTE